MDDAVIKARPDVYNVPEARKALQDDYGLMFPTRSTKLGSHFNTKVVALKFAGLFFLHKLATRMRKDHLVEGRRRLNPVLTRRVCERVNRRITNLAKGSAQAIKRNLQNRRYHTYNKKLQLERQNAVKKRSRKKDRTLSSTVSSAGSEP